MLIWVYNVVRGESSDDGRRFQRRGRAAPARDPRSRRRRRAVRRRHRRRARARSAAGVQAPARPAHRGRTRRARRGPAALLPRQPGSPAAHPRLAEPLRTALVRALRRPRRRARRAQREGGTPMTAPPTSGTVVSLPTDRQILITREFDAPARLVYAAWTTPELVERWWHA